MDPSSVRNFPLTPAVCAHFFSFHCVYQHVGHDENELNCDAFSVSDDIAANKSVCFKLVWVFFSYLLMKLHFLKDLKALGGKNLGQNQADGRGERT